MPLSEAGTYLGKAYASTAVFLFDGGIDNWVYDHAVEFDLGVGAFFVGSVILLMRRDAIARSRSMRLFRGALMKRRDRIKYHNMKIEDAIIDTCMSMVHSGDMTPEEEAAKYKQYAKAYGLTGLMPGKDQASVKRGINLRLLRGWWTAKKKMLIGAAPGVPVDPNYKPEFEVERRGLKTSKYLKEA
jgi:hypothetical protein